MATQRRHSLIPWSEKEVLSKREAAVMLGIGINYINELIVKFDLPAYRVGHHTRIIKADLFDWCRKFKIDEADILNHAPAGSHKPHLYRTSKAQWYDPPIKNPFLSEVEADATVPANDDVDATDATDKQRWKSARETEQNGLKGQGHAVAAQEEREARKERGKSSLFD